MQVSDLTINAEQPGPMELVDWEPLKYLRLKVVHWCVLKNPIRQTSKTNTCQLHVDLAAQHPTLQEALSPEIFFFIYLAD